MTEIIEHDRGLGTAYERYHFYRLLDTWAERYGIESVLEGPVDGMAGVPGVHGVGLARRGVPVVSVVRSADQATITEGIYRLAGGGDNAAVRVLEDLADLGTLPRHDMVIAYHALSLVDDWRQFLARVSRLAKKLVVVTVCNPQNWGVSLIRALGNLRGIEGLDPPESWQVGNLSPVLWSLGRVREHEYFDCPWWPDLQVSPGQTLLDRAKKLVLSRRRGVSFTATGSGSVLAQRFVYGASRWPYFGGEGWAAELEPALARHPSFESAPSWMRARAGHLHAFAVDVAPRTHQARRRLRALHEAEGDGG